MKNITVIDIILEAICVINDAGIKLKIAQKKINKKIFLFIFMEMIGIKKEVRNKNQKIELKKVRLLKKLI